MDTSKTLITREDVVIEFHKAFDHVIGFGLCYADEIQLRNKLMWEEMHEVDEAIMAAGTEVARSGVVQESTALHLLKEMADLQYVLSGTAVSFGFNLEEAFKRVHASNMSKLGDDGRPLRRSDGKVLKGPHYKEPDLRGLV